MLHLCRLLLWEAKPISPPTGVYDSLPLDLLHKYQYFNMPATSDLKLQSHPLNVLKRVAQPGDFVVLKLVGLTYMLQGSTLCPVDLINSQHGLASHASATLSNMFSSCLRQYHCTDHVHELRWA